MMGTDNIIKIKYVDWETKLSWERWDKILQSLFKLKIVSNYEKPDLVLSGCFGHNALQYDCMRIRLSSEDIIPDYRNFDYEIGFLLDQPEDRYLRLPHAFWGGGVNGSWDSNFFIEPFIKKNKIDFSGFMEREFCCRVVSNGDCEYREEFFRVLNSKKYVASGGKWDNNLADGKPVEDKIKFLKGYKFNLAFQNETFEGCVDEKIVDAWRAGCIPIFWGNPSIYKDFIKGSFINVYDFESIEAVCDYILKLEEDDEELYHILSSPLIENKLDVSKQFGDFVSAALMKGIVREFR